MSLEWGKKTEYTEETKHGKNMQLHVGMQGLTWGLNPQW